MSTNRFSLDCIKQSIFAAARTNDYEKLLDVLRNEDNLPYNYNYWIGHTIQDGLWALETALLHGSKEVANILACHLVLGKCILDKKPTEIIAAKSIWCKCLGKSVVRLRDKYFKSLRESRDSPKFIYAKAMTDSSHTKEEFHPFYYVVRDHYSKLITPFEAIERPSAFMALMRLTDDYSIKSPEGNSLIGHIIMSKNVNKNYKLEILNFLGCMDPQFYCPSGPEGLTLEMYCLKTNNMVLWKRLRVYEDPTTCKLNVDLDDLESPKTNVSSEVLSTTNKDIMHYCTNKQLKLYSPQERKKIYLELDGALSTFLIRNTTCRAKEKFDDTLVIEAIEELCKSGQQDQLMPFANVVTDKVLGTLLAQLGIDSKNLDKFKYQYDFNVQKEYFRPEAVSSFEFLDLPQEMAELIMMSLTTRDIINLFSISKKMHQWLKSLNNNEFWKHVYNREKLSLEGDIPMPKMDYKQSTINNQRCKHNLRQGKYQERVLLQVDRPHEPIVDNNWLFVPTANSTLHFMNMHTQEKLVHQFVDTQYISASYCMVESPPLSPPLVAMFSGESGFLCYGRPGTPSTKTVMRLSPSSSNSIYAQSHDRVVVSNRLEVIDLNTQQIISSTQPTSRKVVPNPFNRSMAIGYGNAIEILDKDMLVVQTMNYEWLSNLEMLDEFTIAAIPYANGMVLYDIRKLDAKNREVFISDATYRFSVDVRNQRLLVECEPHKIIAQIDWKTRQWERVWKPMTYGVFPVLHDNYMITSHPYKSQIVGYDFSK